MVAGYAIGGGHVLHLVCDLTIAADNARFGQTGPKVGSFDAGYGSGLLARTIGLKRAKEIWFLCEQYDAATAERWGLVNRVVPLDRLEEETVAVCRRMLEMSPLALRLIKAGFNADSDGLAGRAAARRRRDAPLLHERGGAGGPQRVRGETQAGFREVSAPSVIAEAAPGTGTARGLVDRGPAANPRRGDRAGARRRAWAGRHAVSIPRSLLALLVAVALQIAVNYANDYFDGVGGVDTAARMGPRRLVASGLAPPRAVATAAIVMVCIARSPASSLSLLTTPWLIAAGAAAVLALLLYSGGPRPYAAAVSARSPCSRSSVSSRRAAPHMCSSSGSTRRVLWLAVPVGLLACALLMANNLRDIPTDSRRGQADARGASRRAAEPHAAHRDGRVALVLPSLGALVRCAAGVGGADAGDRPARDRSAAHRAAARPVARSSQRSSGSRDWSSSSARARRSVARVVRRLHVQRRPPPSGDGRDAAQRIPLEGPAGWGECSPLASWNETEREAAERSALEAAMLPFPATGPRACRGERDDPATCAGSRRAAGADVGVRHDQGEGRRRRLGRQGRRDSRGVRTARAIRLDANGAWDVDTALRMLHGAARVRHRARRGSGRVTRGAGDHCAAAPGCRWPRSRRSGPPRTRSRLHDLEAADVIVLKPQRIGGVREALRAAEAAGGAGDRVERARDLGGAGRGRRARRRRSPTSPVCARRRHRAAARVGRRQRAAGTRRRLDRPAPSRTWSRIC